MGANRSGRGKKISTLKLGMMRGLQQALLDCGLPTMPVSVLETLSVESLGKLRATWVVAYLRLVFAQMDRDASNSGQRVGRGRR